MDDHLLFTPSKKSHISKIRRSTKGIIEKWTQNIPKEVPVILEQNCNKWETKIFIKDRESLY